MKKLSLFFSFSFFSFILFSQSENVIQSWVQRFNGPDSLNDVSTAIDANGNIYVTGATTDSVTNLDYITIKYTPAGVQLWARTYDADSLNEQALSITTDAGGNVYVTGLSAGAGTGNDFATIKYDSLGNEIWVARYDGSSPGSNDIGKLIALDNSDNVYVAGSSSETGTGNDYTVIKYNNNGIQQWVAHYAGVANDFCTNAVVTDSQGNVYVTGASTGLSSQDYATIRYGTNGALDWLKRYDGNASGQDVARGVALDANENVYVTGLSAGISTNLDIATIKYLKLPKQLGQLTDDMRTIAMGLLGVFDDSTIKNLMYQNLRFGTTEVDIDSVTTDTIKYFFISISSLIEQAALLNIDLKDSINRTINLINGTSLNKDNVSKILKGTNFNGHNFKPHIFIPYFDTFDSTDLAQNPLVGYEFEEKDYPINGFLGIDSNYTPQEILITKTQALSIPTWIVTPTIPSSCFVDGNLCGTVLINCIKEQVFCQACSSSFPINGIPTGGFPVPVNGCSSSFLNFELKLGINSDGCVQSTYWDLEVTPPNPPQNYAVLSKIPTLDYWTGGGNVYKLNEPIISYDYHGIPGNDIAGGSLTLCFDCSQFDKYNSQNSNSITGALGMHGIYKLSRPNQLSLYFILPMTEGLWYDGTSDGEIYYGTTAPGGNCTGGLIKTSENYFYGNSNAYLTDNSLGVANTDPLASTDFVGISNFWRSSVITVGFASGTSVQCNLANVISFTPSTSGTQTLFTPVTELKLFPSGAYRIQMGFTAPPAGTTFDIRVVANFKNGQSIDAFQTLTTTGTVNTVDVDIRGQIKNYNPLTPAIDNYHIYIYR